MTSETKVRLLDAAESLFSERGIGATSLRTITSAANANLAAVNYHFGSKAELVREVLERRLKPLHEQRLEMLRACVDLPHDDPETLRRVLRAMVEPFLRLLEESEHRGDDFPRLLGRAHFEADPSLHRFFLENFRPTVEAFVGRLGACLPHLSRNQLFSRLLFAIGALTTSINRRIFMTYDSSLAGVQQREEMTGELVDFLSAGFSAEASTGFQVKGR